MKTLIAICILFLTSAFILPAQNLIRNPGFEQQYFQVTGEGQMHQARFWSNSPYSTNNSGLIPSPDLFSRNASVPIVKVPVNKFTQPSGLNERTNLNNYAGLWCQEHPTGVANDERILGELTTPLPARNYTVSGYFAVGSYDCQNPEKIPTNKVHIEIVLRKSTSTNSTVQRVILSQLVPNGGWQKLTANFSIPSTEANQWDRVEVRLKLLGYAAYSNAGQYSVRTVLIDDLFMGSKCAAVNPAFTVTYGTPSNGFIPVTFTAAPGLCNYWEVMRLINQSTPPTVAQFAAPYWYQAGSIGNNAGFSPCTISIPWPVPSGTYYIVRHRAWDPVCGNAESRQVLVFPVPSLTEVPVE